MADIIDINVTETTETVTINTTPNLTTININSVTGGGAVSSVNGQTGDVIVPVSDNNFTNALKTKLDGIATGAEVNVNADWNAVSGDAQILNKPSIPAAQVNSDWNSVSGVSQILNKPTIPTQTSQLTNNGADGTNPFITALDIPTTGQASTIVREVKNMTGATLTKGTVVYISGANGNKALVSKALATTDALSSRTFGLLQSNILNNGLGYCVIIGDLSGLDTSSFTEGDQLYLSGVTAGTYTNTKILAPTHLVYVGKITRSHPTLGQIEVGIQNGYELSEIHDVALLSVANNQLLSFDSTTSLWKNKSVTTADIADSTNKRYQTDNQQTFNDATSSIQTQINAKQNTLVSETNIKSVNGFSLLGSGDLSVKGVHALVKPSAGGSVSVSVTSTALSAQAQTANRLIVSPFIPSQTITCASLYINVSTLVAGSNAQILIYSNLNGKPDTKIYQSANLDCSTAGNKIATTTQTFEAGNTYWIGVHTSSTQSLTVISTSNLLPIFTTGTTQVSSFFITPTFGSAPTTFGTPSNNTATMPYVGITI